MKNREAGDGSQYAEILTQTDRMEDGEGGFTERTQYTWSGGPWQPIGICIDLLNEVPDLLNVIPWRLRRVGVSQQHGFIVFIREDEPTAYERIAARPRDIMLDSEPTGSEGMHFALPFALWAGWKAERVIHDHTLANGNLMREKSIASIVSNRAQGVTQWAWVGDPRAELRLPKRFWTNELAHKLPWRLVLIEETDAEFVYWRSEAHDNVDSDLDRDIYYERERSLLGEFV